MRYLLSTGRSTSDKNLYIQDLILINMTILPDEIPYFDGGSPELIEDYLSEKLLTHVTDTIESILRRIRNSFPKDEVKLDEVEIQGKQIYAIITINGNKIRYDIIQRSN